MGKIGKKGIIRRRPQLSRSVHSGRCPLSTIKYITAVSWAVNSMACYVGGHDDRKLVVGE